MTLFWKLMFMAMAVLSGGSCLLSVMPYVEPYGMGWRYFTALAVAVAWAPIVRYAWVVLKAVPTIPRDK